MHIEPIGIEHGAVQWKTTHFLYNYGLHIQDKDINCGAAAVFGRRTGRCKCVCVSGCNKTLHLITCCGVCFVLFPRVRSFEQYLWKESVAGARSHSSHMHFERLHRALIEPYLIYSQWIDRISHNKISSNGPNRSRAPYRPPKLYANGQYELWSER